MSELFKSAMANTQIHRYRDADSFAKPEIVKVVFAELKKMEEATFSKRQQSASH